MGNFTRYFIVLIVCAGLITTSKVAHAQFNDSTFYHTAFQSTGSINKTRDGTAYLLNNGFKFNVKRKDASLNFNNNWIYGKQNSSVTNNDFSTSLDFNLYKSIPHFYYWGLANYNTSYSLKINAQLLAGLGVAYSIFDRTNAYLNISDGILYDRSDLYLTDTTGNVYSTYRNSLRLQFRFVIKNIITINSGSFLQNSLTKGSDYIIRANLGVDFKLRKWLSLNAAFNYNKMNRTQSENLLFTYGLTADYFF